ncbi:Protein of unknown function [Bacillus mobilis]|nr:Protein of unknown function [Bacillus mobilis]
MSKSNEIVNCIHVIEEEEDEVKL